jgi:hypothetical protein
MCASLNRPDKITLDAYSDPTIDTLGSNGVYSRFTNRLTTPILNAKGIQLLNANFVNSSLQLNDQYQLMFFYYSSSTQAGIVNASNLRCVRLLPSTFVPYTGFTAFTKNRYFNSVQEVVAALNVAASTGGDSATYNPLWVANEITSSYDATTRKVSVVSTSGTKYIAPASADDPIVVSQLSVGSNVAPRMNTYSAGNTYSTSYAQPYVSGQSMNSRLGFAMGYGNRGLWWNPSSQLGCATSTGVPLTTTIEADANPILLGVQNVNVYMDIVAGGGMDSRNRKNLVGSVPIEVAPLFVNSYTLSSVEQPLLSVPSEVYEITIELLDDNGVPFPQPPSWNTQISFSIYYE